MTKLPTTMPGLQDPSAARPASLARWTPLVTAVLSRIVHAISWHWLLLFNTAIGVFALVPILAPVFMFTGHVRIARFIYAALGLSCHQLPERSFFLFGPRLAYTLDELKLLLGPDVPLRYIGNTAIGFKMAVCQRDVAIYLAMLLAGTVFALVRHRLRPLSWRGFAAMCVPMLVDGLGQLLGSWESTPWSRVVSGSLFGVAWIWLVYPHVETAMRQVRETLAADEAGR